MTALEGKYRILNSSDNYNLSFPAAAVPHVWAVSGVGYINTTNKPTEVANSISQIKSNDRICNFTECLLQYINNLNRS